MLFPHVFPSCSKSGAQSITARDLRFMWKPTAGIFRGQAMDEAIHFPGLVAITTFREQHLQPSVVAVPLGLCELKQTVKAVREMWPVPIPQHSQHALFDGFVPRAIALAQGVREHGAIADRPQLPEIACQAEVQTAEHAWLSTAGAI